MDTVAPEGWTGSGSDAYSRCGAMLSGLVSVRALAVASVSGRLQKSDLGKGSDTPGCRDALSPESGETVWNPALSRRALPGIRGDRLEPRPVAISIGSFP